VCDTGIGIAADINVFELFYTTKPQGTGLGLGIARRLIQVHGGTLSYESALGRGTTFTVELPVRRSEQSGEPCAPAQAAQ
jgi:two-component system sensor histidine kinase AtoS